MTTPKKCKYNLRSRALSGEDGSFCESSILEVGVEDEEGIMSEEVPQVLIEGQVEALQEQNKCLQVQTVFIRFSWSPSDNWLRWLLVLLLLASATNMERAKHSFLLCPILLSCLVMNKICLNQTSDSYGSDARYVQLVRLYHFNS